MIKRIIIVAISAFCIMIIAGCSQALSISEINKTIMAKEKLAFSYVHDWSEPKEPSGMVRIKQEMDDKAAKAEAERIAAEEAAAQETYEYYETVYYGGSGNNGDGFIQQGVRDGVNGTTETWYSSNTAYHHRTSEWSADENGYYRDSDGYYVVASEDHAEGEVIETSVGQAKVYDGGCESGVVDFYVNF